MGFDFSDISKAMNRRKKAGGENDAFDESLYVEVMEELTTMSADDMAEALRMIEDDDGETAPERRRPRRVAQPEVVSIHDVYGPDTEPGGPEQKGDSPAHEARTLDAPEVDPQRFDASNPELPASDPQHAGVVKDEIVLNLLEADAISMSQVREAVKSRKRGQALWKALADVEGVDKEQLYADVAAGQGIQTYPALDKAPDRTLIDKLLDQIGRIDLERLLRVQLVPVHLDTESNRDEPRVILVTSDPLDPRVQQAVMASPIEAKCMYGSPEQVSRCVEEVRSWVGRAEGDDIPDYLSFGLDDTLDELADIALAGDVEGGQVDDDSDRTDAENSSTESSAGASVSRHRSSSRENRKSRTTGEEGSLDERISKDRVVRSLIKEELVTEMQVREAVTRFDAQHEEEALWRVLANLPEISREMVFGEAARVYAFKHETIGEGRPDFDFVQLMMETVAEEHREEMIRLLLLPFEHALDMETGSGRVVFVTPDPTKPEVSKLLHELDVGRFEVRYASESAISELLNELFPQKNEYLERMPDDPQAVDLGMTYDEEAEVLDEDALEAEISRSKLINLFEAALVEAVRQGVSDVHIFPNPNRQVEIHFRVDGRLKKWHTEDKVHPEAFLAVVKDNSTNVDRFERDMAQDGFIQRDIDGTLIRFRVSILPIASANQELRAESIVIRILDDRKVLTDITQLGMLDVALERFEKAIRLPHGMVILTGPTGSGKSTTLVAALHQVITPEVNVLTVEDPVEYIINGVRQIKLNNKLNLEGALRAILRHDPDIVMVGEMRDKHTAELAIKLANTGHLTFSTLHTNDAPSAVSRLYKMGIEPFLIAYAINLVVAQRLIREVCPDCKEVDDDPDVVMLKSLGFTEEDIEETTFYKANRDTSCNRCGGNGFKGRRAVCEALFFSREIRNMIAEAGDAIDEEEIRIQALKEGMLTLQDSARELVKMGVTSADEMLRVTATH